MTRRDFTATLAAAAYNLQAQSNSTPGIGFIGLGARSKAHFQAFKDLPEAHIVALCDLDSARIAETNAGLPSKAVGYTDYHELLHDKNASAVVIATHRCQLQRGKQFSGFARPERTRNVIAEVDGRINATGPNVHEHRLKREQIGVDVGYDG